ncbi:MAG: type III-B CRISPR module-associated protein Cmr5 [Firmicutes bacterium]|nr:type III-B CRISPR module-associated protein Cmr5 [Bacillota bacterium]
MPTRQQEWAKRAYQAVKQKMGSPLEADYARVCKTFPALIHNSGLCQAVAFAQAKKEKGEEFGQYLDGLAIVLGTNSGELARRSREEEVLSYQRFTQDTIAAASWMKRYAEALLEDEKNNKKANNGPTEGPQEG